MIHPPFGPLRFPRFPAPTRGHDDAPRVTSVDPTTDVVAGGATVTITGSHFRLQGDGSAPVVLFGAVPGTGVSVVSATELTVTAPAGTGAVDVSVTIDGRTATLASAFTYVQPQITSLTPGTGPVAGGTPVIVEGQGFVTGSTVTFGGVPAAVSTFIDAEHYLAVTPAGVTGLAAVAIGAPTGASFSYGFQYTTLAVGTDIRRMPSIHITDALNNAPNFCTYTVDGQGAKPIVGDNVLFEDNAEDIFAGTIQTVDQDYEGLTSQWLWSVTAVDWIWLLNTKRPVGSYVNVSASSVILDLLTRTFPNSGFTVAHVQTGLPAITIEFDGTQTTSECFTDVAEAIGGGHWDVDYAQDLHFFRIVPSTASQIFAAMHLGPGSAMVVATGTFIGGGGVPFWSAFFGTFVYDDGSESSPWPISNVIENDGRHRFAFGSVPIGAAAGTLTCVRRRIWALTFDTDPVRKFCEITDNTTASFESTYGAVSTDTVSVVAIAPTVALPLRPRVAIPAGTQSAISASAGSGVLLDWAGLPAPYAAGSWRFVSTNLYRDGTESLPSPASSSVVLDGAQDVVFNGVPIGAAVNGISAVARVVYGSVNGGQYRSVVIVPDNTVTSPVPFAEALTHTFALPIVSSVDGPWLENAPPPAAIDDNNLDLLRDPQFKSSEDISQIRNRVTVVGEGTNVAPVPLDATGQVIQQGNVAGSSVIFVADSSVFDAGGGMLQAGGLRMSYYGATDALTEGPGKVYVSYLAKTLPEGTPVYPFVTENDLASQRARGLVERDANGNQTDGIHEYTIPDSALWTTSQMRARAKAELQLFAWPIVSISYATRGVTKSGQLVAVNLTNPPCVGEFLVQSVNIDQIQEFAGVSPRYTVQASSVKFDLLDLLMKHEKKSKRIPPPKIDALIGEILPDSGATGPPRYSQTRARWRNDDGDEQTATWLSTEDSPTIVFPKGAPYGVRLRFQVQKIGGVEEAIDESTGAVLDRFFVPEIQFSVNGSGYFTIGGGLGSLVSTGNSPQSNTTPQMTSPGGMFVPGYPAGVIHLRNGDYTEIEYGITLNVDDTVEEPITVTVRLENFGELSAGNYVTRLLTYEAQPTAFAYGTPRSRGPVGNAAIKSFDFSLSNAEILTLSSVRVGPVFQGTPGKAVLIIGGILHTNVVNSYIDGQCFLRFQHTDGATHASVSFPLNLFSAGEEYHYCPFDDTDPISTGEPYVGDDFYIVNEGSDFTGGNAANFIRGIIQYIEIDSDL